ncbi:AT-rich interactive domain-containing protein 4 [Macadamia integrifolia]|uniref:AT-rich interactive domain-containing protein 4 n=1 Tax=Macadamia integrifolia TaxID=60698 RepID=UPI001C4EEB0C|nr:AT-rich interactive domain-containing protein 4 [Macadamia integrifolia]XP_042483706.1 AT-rich interactive domain-containing protein 4 [Macadamia integrifolia]
MMFHAQGPSKNTCSLLAVLCGKIPDYKQKQENSEDHPRYPFPELVSSGRLEVQTLTNPTIDEFRRVFDSLEPSFVYLKGEQLSNEEEIGSLVWGDVDLSSPEAISAVFGSTLPSTVYLEIPNGEKLAEALYSKGVPYVIYWKNAFSCYAACHFRHALISVVQSSCSHTWDAFQLANASFRLFCVRNNHVLPANSHKVSGKLGPRLLGEPPKINISPPEKDAMEEEEEGSNGSLPAIKIYDDDVSMRFLICGLPCKLDAFLLGSLEDGLNALLSIELRGSKLHNRVSAPPPPLQAGTFSRGVVTMRCDFSTCSSAHISLLVSGSAQTCFDDQLLENHIKNELIEKSQLVHALPSCEENKPPLSEPRNSASIACGATVFEVCMKVPTWAAQVLKQLAPDVSYRSLVTLGIASIQGSSVASFEKDDAERFLFFCTRLGKDLPPNKSIPSNPPRWLKSPEPGRKRSEPCLGTTDVIHSRMVAENGATFTKIEDENEEFRSIDEVCMPSAPVRQKLKIAAMRPIPHTRQHKMLPFLGIPEADGNDGGQAKPNLAIVPSTKHNFAGPTPATHRKSFSSSYQAQQIISLNPLPLKKHGCGRCPIQVCSEEEFLRDVMQFLILRGHTRLVPQGGLAEFPEAILNAKRLDLYNLYREVVSRGGFHVGNGINWKGQVFSKMRNHTLTNRMTGVGNTLKRHYETYLLEYELAHDDVDGECCLLCHSSAAGDWVNCGICGEWAHFGCDRRQGLGAFKDYAKTDGLEYICPHCSITNFRSKPQKTANGFA